MASPGLALVEVLSETALQMIEIGGEQTRSQNEADRQGVNGDQEYERFR